MNDTVSAIVEAAVLVLALAVCFRPLGDYMARVFTATKHSRIERGLYRIMGVEREGFKLCLDNALDTFSVEARQSLSLAWQLALDDREDFHWAGVVSRASGEARHVRLGEDGHAKAIIHEYDLRRAARRLR